MYNHKLRGRPDDPKNQAISAQKKSLAQTIQVNSLSPSCNSTYQPSDIEIARCRQHYNEFKKSYELKHRTNSRSLHNDEVLPKLPIIKESAHVDMYKLEAMPKHKVVKGVKIVETKPIYERPPTCDKSHVNVSSWTAESEPIFSSYPNDAQAMLLIERLKEMEMAYAKIPQQTVGTQSILEQAEKEAYVAHDQLEAIQRLIMVDRGTAKPSTSLATIDEEVIETHPNGHRKKVVDATKKKIRNAKKNSMVMTLNNLNQRIQQMHEKYFNEPRFKYMSLNDVKRMSKFEKNIEMLYKNDDFDPQKEISEVLLPVASDSNKNDVLIQREKPVNIIRKSASIPVERNQFCCDISSDNYLLNKNVRKRVRFEECGKKIETNHCQCEQPSETQTSMNDSSWLTIDECVSENKAEPSSSSRRHISGDCGSTSDKVDILLSPRGFGLSKSSSTLQSIQENILKSEFLMKEFDLTPNDLTTGLSNFEASQQVNISRRSMTTDGVPSLQEFFSATSNNKSNCLKKAYMEDSIRTQLKHSLYDIF